MKTKIITLLAIVFAMGIGALIVYLPLKQENDRLANQLAQSSGIEKVLNNKIKEMTTTQGLQLEKQKKVGLFGKKEGLVYFSQKTIPLSNNQIRIDISLSGEKNTSVDAADLVLSYSPTLNIKEIKKGTTFPSYPRSTYGNGIITITGLALPHDNLIAYGRTNEVYATIILEKLGKGAIEVNTKDTQAYFNGTPILDFTNSFKTIEL